MTAFSDLALDQRVLQAIAEAGYTAPTPIQAQAIPHALEGRDVLGIAQTGTGKTASFVLPMITRLARGRARARMPRTLVLAPTRELAAQVAENFETYAKHVKLSMALLIGGVSFKDQDKLIDRGVDVLIATPGRLLDHFERGKLMLTAIEIMVVDEADRMLDMGFIPDIERIFKLTPPSRQTLFFSATMAPEITRLTKAFLKDPVRVEVARQATTGENIDQVICMHTPTRKDRLDAEKREVLRRLIQAEGDSLTNGIIFCNRKRDVDVVARSLKRHGFNAEALHGDLDQSVRTRILTQFRNDELTLLVASDVAARGLDIPRVTHVFNYDVPSHAEDYVHRIGRTGRAGRKGRSITIHMPADEKYLDRIEALVKKTIPRMDSPLASPAAGDAAAARTPDAAQAEGPKPAGRSSRSRSRRRSRADAPERQAERPADMSAPAAAAEGGRQSPASAQADRTDPAGGTQNARPTGTPAPSAPAHPAAEAQPGGRSGQPQRRDHGARIGMGDHVPAFLLRPLGLPEDDADQPAPTADAAPRARRSAKAGAAAQPAAEAPPAEAGAARKTPRRRRTTAARTTHRSEPALIDTP